MADVRFAIRPHKQQLIFMDRAEKEQLFGGAKRGGKSVALCQKIIALSMAFPGNRGLLIRQTLADLKDSTLVTFFQVCPPGLIASHHLTDRIIRFVNGSWFSYRGVGDPDDLEKVKGVEVGWLAVDEPSEIDESIYLMILAQLNWRLPNGSRPAYMTLLACNPEPGWVKKRFVDHLGWQRGKGVVTDGKRCFIPSYAKDNPGLPDDYIAYLRENFPEDWVQKYVDGSWEISEGMVYKELDEGIHRIAALPDGLLQHCRIYGSLDPAPATITAKVDIAIDSEFNHYVFWEYYRTERLLRDHASDILDRLAWYNVNQYHYEYTLIDPSSSQRTNVRNDDDRLQSIRELYAEQGLHCIPAWNSLEGGIERVKQLLHVDPTHIHPITGQLGSPRLFFLRSCSNAWEEAIGWQRKVGPDGTVRYSGLDHAIDNIRYIVNSRPRPPISTARDDSSLSSTTLKARRSHNQWAAKWDKTIRQQETGGGDYFGYLGNSTPGSNPGNRFSS